MIALIICVQPDTTSVFLSLYDAHMYFLCLHFMCEINNNNKSSTYDPTNLTSSNTKVTE